MVAHFEHIDVHLLTLVRRQAVQQHLFGVGFGISHEQKRGVAVGQVHHHRPVVGMGETADRPGNQDAQAHPRVGAELQLGRAHLLAVDVDELARIHLLASFFVQSPERGAVVFLPIVHIGLDVKSLQHPQHATNVISMRVRGDRDRNPPGPSLEFRVQIGLEVGGAFRVTRVAGIDQQCVFAVGAPDQDGVGLPDIDEVDFERVGGVLRETAARPG